MSAKDLSEYADYTSRSVGAIMGRGVDLSPEEARDLVLSVGPVLFDNRELIYRRDASLLENPALHTAIVGSLKKSYPLLGFPGATGVFASLMKKEENRDEMFLLLLRSLELFINFVVLNKNAKK